MSASRMRIAVTADTRNFDAAMRHVKGQAAQARRSVAPALGLMGGGMGRMAGMGLGMAAMGGPMAAVAAATAAVATAVNAIKQRNESQDTSLREIIERGMGPQQQAQFQAMAQMISPTGRAADIQQLIESFAGMSEQQKLDMESVIGPSMMRFMEQASPRELMRQLSYLQRTHGSQFTDQLGAKEAGMVRAISRLGESDMNRAFGQQANLGDAVQREERRIENIGAGFFERIGLFLKRSFMDAQATAPLTRQNDRARELQELERLGRVPV